MSQALLGLEKFQALSEAMASAAEAQEWDDLLRIGAERDALSKNLPADLAARLPVAEQSSARRIIEHCQQLDVQVQTLTEERQKALRVLLRIPNPLT